MKTQGTRLYWIDTLKAIGIFFVLFGHSLKNGPLVYYIYAFHVPLFFLISGYLFDYEKYRDFKYLLYRKIRTLVVPYFCFAAISYLFWLIVIRSLSIRGESVAMDPIKPLLGIFYAVGGPEWELPLNVALWFIPCIFVTEILFWILRTLIQKNWLLCLALMLLGIFGFWASQVMQIRLPWSIDVAFTAIVFYGIGYLCRSMQFNFSTFSSIQKMLLLLFLLVVHTGMSLLNGKADMNTNYYGNILYFYMAALAGAGFYLMVSIWIPPNWITTIVGKNTIVIIGLSGNALFIILGLIYLASKATEIFTSAPLWASALYSILEIGFLFPVFYIIDRYFPFIIGRNKSGIKA
jgi:acyltransferase